MLLHKNKYRNKMRLQRMKNSWKTSSSSWNRLLRKQCEVCLIERNDDKYNWVCKPNLEQKWCSLDQNSLSLYSLSNYLSDSNFYQEWSVSRVTILTKLTLLRTEGVFSRASCRKFCVHTRYIWLQTSSRVCSLCHSLNKSSWTLLPYLPPQTYCTLTRSFSSPSGALSMFALSSLLSSIAKNLSN